MGVADVTIASHISAEAGIRFADVDDPRIAACADDPPFTVDELSTYVAAGRAWVATEGDEVVGFVVADIIDGVPHIEELDIAVGAGQRGHGARLLNTVIDWADQSGKSAITLTTFGDVPWNRPWYERHGFRVLADEEITPELSARRTKEHEEGLPAELRVAMRLALR
jgi:GNAT superfamily N-acetyltransferase